MTKQLDDILSEARNYYSNRLLEHGEVPQGVDWNGEESQFARFKQLAKVIDGTGQFSLNDLGCGYGAMVDYLEANYQDYIYHGYDVSPEMIKAAKNRYINQAHTHFLVDSKPTLLADYGVASGIFNVKLERQAAEWQRYMKSSLDKLHATSRLGFAFNCLTSYSDADKMRNYLYYADPCELFDYCKKRYSRHVSLLHDYGLYEFTLIVRKNV